MADNIILINGQEVKIIKLGKCACGCGGDTRISPETDKRRNRFKGQPFKYIMGHAGNKPKPHWSEGKILEIPIGLCQCGCGKKTAIANRTTHSRGIIKGLPVQYYRHHHKRSTGSENQNWKGGRCIKDGYVYIHMPEHPRANMRGYVREHILICEKALGKPLPPGAVPHHVNGKRGDNRNQNLVLCQDNAYNKLLHIREKALKACGNPNYRRCIYCKVWDTPTELKIQKSGTVWHQKCRNEYDRERKQKKINQSIELQSSGENQHKGQ